MLVLSRKEGQTILIGEATLTVIKIQGGQVRIGIEAPQHVAIQRLEIKQAIDRLSEGE